MATNPTKTRGVKIEQDYQSGVAVSGN